MKQPFRSESIGFATFVLSTFAVLNAGCGAINANGFLGWEVCDILNCDGLFFAKFADDHDDMAGMDAMDDHGGGNPPDDDGGDAPSVAES